MLGGPAPRTKITIVCIAFRWSVRGKLKLEIAFKKCLFLHMCKLNGPLYLQFDAHQYSSYTIMLYSGNIF